MWAGAECLEEEDKRPDHVLQYSQVAGRLQDLQTGAGKVEASL